MSRTLRSWKLALLGELYSVGSTEVSTPVATDSLLNKSSLKIYSMSTPGSESPSTKK